MQVIEVNEKQGYGQIFKAIDLEDVLISVDSYDKFHGWCMRTFTPGKMMMPLDIIRKYTKIGARNICYKTPPENYLDTYRERGVYYELCLYDEVWLKRRDLYLFRNEAHARSCAHIIPCNDDVVGTVKALKSGELKGIDFDNVYIIDGCYNDLKELDLSVEADNLLFIWVASEVNDAVEA